MEEVSVPFSVLISKEDEWFVAECPILGIATQGKTEAEVRENMSDLIEEYMEDPDTQKPSIKTMMTATISIVNIPLKMGVSHGRAEKAKAG